MSYSLRTDKLPSVNDRRYNDYALANYCFRRSRPSDSRGDSSLGRDSSSGSNRGSGSSVTLRSLRAPLNVLGRSARSLSLFQEMQRRGIHLARPVSSVQIPASDVPENLIEQCQTVLQVCSHYLSLFPMLTCASFHIPFNIF